VVFVEPGVQQCPEDVVHQPDRAVGQRVGLLRGQRAHHGGVPVVRDRLVAGQAVFPNQPQCGASEPGPPGLAATGWWSATPGAKRGSPNRSEGQAAQREYGHLVDPRSPASCRFLLENLHRVPVLVARLPGRATGERQR